MDEPPVIEEYKSELFFKRSPQPRKRRPGTRLLAQRAGTHSGSALDLLRAALRARQPFPTPADAEAPDRARAVAQISTALAELASAALLGVAVTWTLVTRHSTALLVGLDAHFVAAPPPLLLAAALAAAAATCLLVHALAPEPRSPVRTRCVTSTTATTSSHATPPPQPQRHRGPMRGPWLLVIILNTAALLGVLAGIVLTWKLRSYIPLESYIATSNDSVSISTRTQTAPKSYVPPLEAAGGASEEGREGGWTDARSRLRLRHGSATKYLHSQLSKSLHCCRKHWNHLQTQLQCCGVDGPYDWRNHKEFPDSCCKGGDECFAPWVEEENTIAGPSAVSRWSGSLWHDGCLVPMAIYLADSSSLLIGLACVLAAFVVGSLALSGALWAREAARGRGSGSADGSPPPSARGSLVGADDFAGPSFGYGDDPSADADGLPASAAAASLDACFSSSSSAASVTEEAVRAPRRPASAAAALPTTMTPRASQTFARPTTALPAQTQARKRGEPM